MQSHRSRLVWPLIVFVHSPCELSSVQSERTARGPLTSSRESRRTEYWTPFSLNLHSSLFCQLHQLLTTLWHGVELAYRHTHSLTQTMQMYIGRGLVNKHTVLYANSCSCICIYSQTETLQPYFAYTNSKMAHKEYYHYIHCGMTMLLKIKNGIICQWQMSTIF